MVLIVAVLLSAHFVGSVYATGWVSSPDISIGTADFGPINVFRDFWSTTPRPGKSAIACAQKCWFDSEDPWLKETLPMWQAHGAQTFPLARNLSAVRLLGGWATRHPNNSYTENPEYDLVTRDASGALIYNWSRLDSTFESFLAFGVSPSPIVFDNVPYAFVKDENRYFCENYGLASAPDNATEFSVFIGALVQHLVERFGVDQVASWSFRLGTEANGPRIGPIWQKGVDKERTADGHFIELSGGLDEYVDTYVAVGAAVKRVSPKSAFGPSNMHALSLQKNEKQSYLDEFADRIHAAGAPLDFIAASTYSKWDLHGNAPVQSMAAPIARLAQLARRAITGTDAGSGAPVPIEVHEFGWATWGKFNSKAYPAGAFSAAWCVSSWLWQRSAGAGSIFHWANEFDNSLSRQTPLVTGWGWALTAMEELRGIGGDTMGSDFVQDVSSKVSPTGFSYNNTIGGFRTTQPESGKLQYLLVAYSANYTEHTRYAISLRISEADWPKGVPFGDHRDAFIIFERVLNTSTSVHDIIQQDLQTAGGYPRLLTNQDPSVSIVNKMGTSEGLKLVLSNSTQYMRINQASLKSVPFSGKVKFDHKTQELVLEMEMQTPSLLLLTLKAASSAIV